MSAVPLQPAPDAQVLPMPAGRHGEVGLTYPQLATYLYQRVGWKPSKRWLQQRRAEGLPFYTDMGGRVRFLPSQAMPWLEGWTKQRGRKLG